MALVRPDKYPRYASTDVVDPTSSVNNVVEPSEAKKDLGHGPLGEFPPRQYQNWFMRMVWKWAKYLDGEQTTHGVFAVKITTPYLTAQQDFNIEWTIVKDIVAIWLPTVSGTSNNTGLVIVPVGNGGLWPTELVATDNQWVPANVVDNNILRMGAVIPPKTTGTNLIYLNSSSTGSLGVGGFTGSGTKGIQRQTIIYKRDFT